MGGYGSTRWRWHSKAPTVERSLTLDLSELRRWGFDPAERALFMAMKWTDSGTGQEIASMGYSLRPDGDGAATMTLRYRAGKGDRAVDCCYPVGLVASPCRFGGRRWWFLCPECQRRRVKLHLPPGGERFACRVCHGLTYRSAQTHDARVDFYRNHPEALLAALRCDGLPRSSAFWAALEFGRRRDARGDW